jgi:O-antigen ligase
VLPLDVYIVLPPHRPVAYLSQIVAAEALIILGLAALATRLLRRATPLALSWMDVLPLGAILCASLISTTAASSPGDAAAGCLKVAVYLSIYLLASAVRSLPGMRSLALTTLVLGAAVVLVVGLLSANPNAPDFAGALLNIQRSPTILPKTKMLRAVATFRYPNELAAYLLLILPLLVAFALRARSKVERLAFWVLTAFGFWVLALTYARGALIAFLIVCPIIFFLLCERKVALAGTTVTIVVAVGLALFSGGQSDRLFSVLTLDDPGYATRFATWGWALDAFLRHPLVGVGLDNLRNQPNAPYVDLAGTIRSFDAENLYLNALAELGLLGAIPILVALVGALRRAACGLRAEKSWIDASWNTGVLSALIALLLYGLVDPVLLSGQVTGLLCALVGLSGPLVPQTRRLLNEKAQSASPSLTPDEAPPGGRQRSDWSAVARERGWLRLRLRCAYCLRRSAAGLALGSAPCLPAVDSTHGERYACWSRAAPPACGASGLWISAGACAVAERAMSVISSMQIIANGVGDGTRFVVAILQRLDCSRLHFSVLAPHVERLADACARWRQVPAVAPHEQPRQWQSAP